MTFLWLDNQGLPRRPLRQRYLERRVDDSTAADIADALRARGVQAAALAMDHLQVDMDVALRVLAGPNTRRGTLMGMPSAYRKERREDRKFVAVGAKSELADA